MKTYEELAKGVSGMTEKEILRQEMEILLLDSRRNSVKEIAPQEFMWYVFSYATKNHNVANTTVPKQPCIQEYMLKQFLTFLAL